MIELWLDIEGYEGKYLVSSQGRVRSLARKRTANYGSVRVVQERILKPRVSGSGYSQVTLFKDGVRDMRSVHRLVAETFLKKRPDCKQVNHIDGIKTNNCSTNLEWVNQRENQLHAYRLGLQKHQYGSQRFCAKLNEQKVSAIKHQIRNGAKLRDLAKQYDVNPVTISDIKRGATWARV